MHTKLLTEKEAAAKYCYSVHWFRRQRWAGGGPEYIQVGKHGRVLYDDAKLEEFFYSRLRRSTSDHAA